MKNHINSNQENLDYYNKMVKATNNLSGCRNSAPQNSGEIMANINLSAPIFDHRGYMSRTGSFADSRQVRGEENVLILLDRLPDHINSFRWMKILEVEPAYFGGKKTKKYQWLKLTSREEVINLISENKKLLNKS